MRQYILNLTNHLIGKYDFDELKQWISISDVMRQTFFDQVYTTLSVRDVADMNPETLGKILCSLQPGDVQTDHLGRESNFAGGCERLLRDIVARALAYVIRDRLDDKLGGGTRGGVPQYKKK